MRKICEGGKGEVGWLGHTPCCRRPSPPPSLLLPFSGFFCGVCWLTLFLMLCFRVVVGPPSLSPFISLLLHLPLPLPLCIRGKSGLCLGGWMDGWMDGWGEQEKLGEVRDFPSIRKMFMQIPAEFCSKVICAGVSSRDASALDFGTMSDSAGDGMGEQPGAGAAKGTLTGEAVLTEASRLLTATVKPGACLFYFILSM